METDARAADAADSVGRAGARVAARRAVGQARPRDPAPACVVALATGRKEGVSEHARTAVSGSEPAYVCAYVCAAV